MQSFVGLGIFWVALLGITAAYVLNYLKYVSGQPSCLTQRSNMPPPIAHCICVQCISAWTGNHCCRDMHSIAPLWCREEENAAR